MHSNEPRTGWGSGDEAAAKKAHDEALAAIGNPSSAPLQIDVALARLKIVIDVHAEMVRALIRRVEPVSAEGMRIKLGSIICSSMSGQPEPFIPSKAPIASSILCQHEIIEDLTKELQQAIRELQI